MPGQPPWEHQPATSHKHQHREVRPWLSQLGRPTSSCCARRAGRARSETLFASPENLAGPVLGPPAAARCRVHTARRQWWVVERHGFRCCQEYGLTRQFLGAVRGHKIVAKFLDHLERDRAGRERAGSPSGRRARREAASSPWSRPSKKRGGGQGCACFPLGWSPDAPGRVGLRLTRDGLRSGVSIRSRPRGGGLRPRNPA